MGPYGPWPAPHEMLAASLLPGTGGGGRRESEMQCGECRMRWSCRWSACVRLVPSGGVVVCRCRWKQTNMSGPIRKFWVAREERHLSLGKIYNQRKVSVTGVLNRHIGIILVWHFCSAKVPPINICLGGWKHRRCGIARWPRSRVDGAEKIWARIQ